MVDACPSPPTHAPTAGGGPGAAADTVLAALTLLAPTPQRSGAVPPPPQPPRAALMRPPAPPPPAPQPALQPYASYSYVPDSSAVALGSAPPAPARAVLVGGTLLALLPTSQQLCLARVGLRVAFSRRVRASSADPWRVAPASEFSLRCLWVAPAGVNKTTAWAAAWPLSPDSEQACAQSLQLSMGADGTVSAVFLPGGAASATGGVSLCGAECWLEGHPAFAGAFFAWEHSKGLEMDLAGLEIARPECAA